MQIATAEQQLEGALTREQDATAELQNTREAYYILEKQLKAARAELEAINRQSIGVDEAITDINLALDEAAGLTK